MSAPRTIRAEPLTPEAFAPFGRVIEARGEPHRLINDATCGRWHDLAPIDVAGRPGISLFLAEPRPLPLTVDLLERHPLGSQAFVPMTEHPFLVVVAGEEPRAFLTAPGQGVSYARGAWHAPLIALHAPGLFAVVDQVSDEANLETCQLQKPLMVGV